MPDGAFGAGSMSGSGSEVISSVVGVTEDVGVVCSAAAPPDEPVHADATRATAAISTRILWGVFVAMGTKSLACQGDEVVVTR